MSSWIEQSSKNGLISALINRSLRCKGDCSSSARGARPGYRHWDSLFFFCICGWQHQMNERSYEVYFQSLAHVFKGNTFFKSLSHHYYFEVVLVQLRSVLHILCHLWSCLSWSCFASVVCDGVKLGQCFRMLPRFIKNQMDPNADIHLTIWVSLSAI